MLPFFLRPFSIRLKVTDVEGQQQSFAPILALVDVAMTWFSRKRASTRFSDENRPVNYDRKSDIGLEFGRNNATTGDTGRRSCGQQRVYNREWVKASRKVERWKLPARSRETIRVSRGTTKGSPSPLRCVSDATGADPVSFSGLEVAHARADLALAK